MEILYTSPWVPPEWIAAYGHIPRGAWFAEYNPGQFLSGQSQCHEPASCFKPEPWAKLTRHDESKLEYVRDGSSSTRKEEEVIYPGAAPLAEGVCAFAQSMADLAQRLHGKAIILTTACDQMRRVSDGAPESLTQRVFLFNLPATWQSLTARKLYLVELARLGRFLEVLGGCPPADGQLIAVMRQFAEKRRYLRGWIQENPGFRSVQAVANFFWSGIVPAQAAPSSPDMKGKIPLALVGGPLLASHWSVLETLEALGGCLVLNATEPGERCLLPSLPELSSQTPPWVALGNHYFDHAIDVFHRPNSRLYEWLAPRLEARQVRGIILWAHVGCDLWRAEVATLQEEFRQPVLVLEAHSVWSGNFRHAQRLAAFMESLQ